MPKLMFIEYKERRMERGEGRDRRGGEKGEGKTG